MIEVNYEGGSLTLKGIQEKDLEDLEPIWDERTLEWRLLGMHYRKVIETLVRKKLEFIDHAKAFSPLIITPLSKITPRKHQSEALVEFKKTRFRATVSMPTGGGKTLFAIMCILEVKRPTLIVVPTIDLMNQWREVLYTNLGISIGLLGGGHHNVELITVTTYDSGSIYIPQYGNKFGFIIFDECHHLPSESNKRTAELCIAPFRLGLSATVARPDGKESIIYELLGPLVYEGHVGQLVGATLSKFKVVTYETDLTEDELELYQHHRSIYVDFLKRSGVNLSAPDGWRKFLGVCYQSKAGKEAYKSYRAQRKLAQSGVQKFHVLWDILREHQGEWILIFTDSIEQAYQIAQMFLVPVLTSQTKKQEREDMLNSFKEGRLKVLVSSRVLNEGVDVPEASVAVVFSGTSTVREHVQRLGRVLRVKEGKMATFYEIISKGTVEQFVNKKRKEHNAYQRSYSV